MAQLSQAPSSDSSRSQPATQHRTWLTPRFSHSGANERRLPFPPPSHPYTPLYHSFHTISAPRLTDQPTIRPRPSAHLSSLPSPLTVTLIVPSLHSSVSYRRIRIRSLPLPQTDSGRRRVSYLPLSIGRLYLLDAYSPALWHACSPPHCSVLLVVYTPRPPGHHAAAPHYISQHSPTHPFPRPAQPSVRLRPTNPPPAKRHAISQPWPIAPPTHQVLPHQTSLVAIHARVHSQSLVQSCPDAGPLKPSRCDLPADKRPRPPSRQRKAQPAAAAAARARVSVSSHSDPHASLIPA